MRKRIGMIVFAAFVACGNMGNGGGGTGGGGTDGTGGGGTGGTGGGGTGGTGGGGTGGTGGGGTGGTGGGGGTGGTGGGSGGGEPDYVSGSRIKARVASTPDGAKAFTGFYDSTLATPCSVGRAADDTVRCLPAVTAYAGSYWADSGCSTPLAYAAGCVGTYASRAEAASTCVDVGYGPTGYRTHIYRVGPVYTGTIWVGTPGSCTMVNTSPYALYSLSEASPSTFSPMSVDNAP